MVLQGSLLGLAAAHRRGVVHRDYKPENVLIDGAGVSKLTDFGIAARAGDRPMAAGTLAYAPPEQFTGSPASPATDVYAATATFYECLTGRPPFDGDTAEMLMRQHQSEPVPLEPVPEPLRPLVAAGLAKDPGRRPADGAALVAELRAVAGRRVRAGLGGPRPVRAGRGGAAAGRAVADGRTGRGAGQRRAPDLAAPAHPAAARQPGQGSRRGRRRGRGRGGGRGGDPHKVRGTCALHRHRHPPQRGRHVGRQRLGGGLRWHQMHQGADPALERHDLGAGAKPEPRGQPP